MELKQLLETLQQERDELKVKMHLAKLDLQDEWEKIEKKWPEFQSRAEEIVEGTKDVADEVVDSVKVVGEEIKATYERIRQRI